MSRPPSTTEVHSDTGRSVDPAATAGRATTNALMSRPLSTNVAQSTSSACVVLTHSSSSPPPARPSTWLPWLLSIVSALPATYSCSRGSTSGNVAARAASNGGPSHATAVSSTSSTGSGAPGTARPSTRTARAASQSSITRRRDQRSPRAARNGAPSSHGNNEVAYAAAAARTDPERSKTSTVMATAASRSPSSDSRCAVNSAPNSRWRSTPTSGAREDASEGVAGPPSPLMSCPVQEVSGDADRSTPDDAR